ncbi:MAG: BMP family ABC transporter substrate-binding protein [Rhodospirillales bacterium]|nr:BMP family ABC transporter substrate-binding protein [Rhodospirillales bacterium]
MIDHKFNRRTFLKGLAAGTAGVSVAGLPFGAGAAGDVTIGVVYVGSRTDFGWSQSHAVAIKELKKVSGIRVVEEEQVPETAGVVKSIESMIQLDDAKMIYGTSFGYFDPHMIKLAKKYPDLHFRHPTALWNPDKHPKNLGGYFCYLDQAFHVDGIAAGMMTKTNKIGYVAAKPISLVIRNINAFMLGVRKVNPDAVVQLIFTGEWTLPVREAEAANALIDAGCDVLAVHNDSPKVVVETAENRGKWSLGHNSSQRELAPNGFLTGAENKWETIYISWAKDLLAGKTPSNTFYAGYDQDLVRNTPYGDNVPQNVRNRCDAAIADLRAGKPVFVGSIKDNKGAQRIDKTLGNYDPYLESIDWLMEGVVGSTT